MPAYKNQFGRADHYDHDIQDSQGRKIGTLRVKPVGVAWKAANKQAFRSVSLDQFISWGSSTNGEISYGTRRGNTSGIKVSDPGGPDGDERGA